MCNLVLVTAVAALLSGGCWSANVNRHMKLLAEMNNNIHRNSVSPDGTKKILTLTKRPPPFLIHEPGTTLELTCEALAAPAPSIHWLRNNAPVYEYDLESNEILDTNPTSLARINSTLLVPISEGEAEYTCVVASGAKTARATTVVFGKDGSTELSERIKLVPLAPRILVSYKILVDTIGSNIVLPCRVKGHPRPQVTWRDNNGLVIKKDSRRKVLRSGELVISSLRWSEMGDFTCHASNMFGSQQVTTFVYPARPNETDG